MQTDNDMIDLSAIQSDLERVLNDAKLPNARMYKVETFFLYSTHLALAVITIAVIYCCAIGALPWGVAIVLTPLFISLACANHLNHYNPHY